MFVEVIVPVSVPKTYTYGVPIEYHEQIQIGQRVEVEFGRRKRYAAVVVRTHNQPPAEYKPKPIISIIDERPLILPKQLEFWQWIESYYMANIGDVMSAALPSALKLSSETSIHLIMQDDFDIQDLDDDEFLLFEALSKQQELKIEEVQLILDKKNVYPVLNRMMQMRIIAIKEKLKEKYKPKKKSYIKLHENYENEEQKHQLLDELERAPKQQELVLHYLKEFNNSFVFIEKKQYLDRAGISSSILKSLVDKGIFVEKKREVNRLQDDSVGDLSANLTVEQQVAFEEVSNLLNQDKITLLHGVTGSGKTHIYIKLLEQIIQSGKQALYLLPEIALTSQIIKRLKEHFGSEVGVYHSKFSDAERVEIWNKVFNQEYKIVLGARSAIFLPFQQLDLIVVDEEHDSSYKQYDPSPRYHGRDAAIYLAHLHQAKVLLGSATPSFESYFNAKQEKYGLVNLHNRYGDTKLPTIEIVNMLKQRIPGKTYKQFSKRLIDDLRETIGQKKQAIIFRNRRGYSSFVQCKQCAHTIKCEKCDVSLTYHKYRDQLECHYCGYTQKIPYRCPACNHNEMEKVGLGTEKIEEELSVFLPTAKLSRMDLDTTRTKYGHEKIIYQFEQKEIDVLVGTQMITKGLHFDDVQLVGVINADALLKFPDFRAGERAFQLLEQVSGRSGRVNEGLVIIQVRDEKDVVLRYLKQHDYIGYYNATIQERLQWKYPPYFRLIKITVKHKDWKKNYQAATTLANELRRAKVAAIKGPGEPFVSKINNYYIQEILITLEKKAESIQLAKRILQEKIDFVHQQKGNSQIRFNIDVDVM